MMNSQPGHNVRKLRRPDAAAKGAGRRLTAKWAAELRVDGASVDCTVENVSSAGASLTVNGFLNDAAEICLGIKQFAPIPAVVAWREKGRVGVRFLAEQAWVQQMCQQRFDAAAWVQNS